MAKNSEFMAKFMGKNSKSMAETAVQAAKLGLEMSSISSMMDSILDIESSIEKEMQVSVLLGRQISFDKARQLAMAGKTVEATKEILKQVGGIAEFEKMSVIQRKALADAAGVDLATMQSMVGNRQKQIEMGLVEASTWESIWETGVGIGTTIKDNMGLAAATTNMLANFQLLGALGWAKEKVMAAWRWVTRRKEHAKTMIEMKQQDAQGKWRDAKGRFTSAPSTAASPQGAKMAGKSMSKGKGGGFMKSMSKIKVSKVLAGAAAMVLVAAAVFVFGKALQEFTKVGGNEIALAAVSMLLLVGAVSALGSIMMSGVGALAIIAGAGAMLIVAAAMWVLGKALQEIGKAIPSFMLLIPALPSLAFGLLTLIPVMPFMSLIGMGMMALGIGFGLGAIGVGLFGMIGGTEIITGLAAGMAVLVPLAGGIALLGGAFATMALGIAALAGSLLLLTPMLPTLILLGGLAMGVGAIMGGLGGGGEDSSSKGMDKIAEKLDTLIDLMKEPGVVKMDGQKVGEVIALARGPLGM
jgi:hypothetical protein